MKIETKAVHAGERRINRQNRSVTIPTEQTAAYFFENTFQIHRFYAGKLRGVKYGRYGCPTQHAAEEKIASLEEADRALLFASGMAALTTSVLALVRECQHILFVGDCYRNTRRFFNKVLQNYGIKSTEVPIEDVGRFEDYANDSTTLFFAEVPTNPFLRVLDLDILARMKKRGITTIIDSTFATPINLRPLECDADLVLHSATKYLGGHNDLFAGVVAGRKSLIQKIQEGRDIFGGITDPHTSSLLLRSLQTLPIRMKTHNKNALAVSKWLEKRPEIERIWYPGLKSHPDHNIAKSQMSGFGGVITFSLKATEKKTSRFVDALSIPYNASNFGSSQSLMEQHAVLTFYRDRAEAEKRGITGNLLRYSTGFENIDDVLEDFDNAFKVLKR